MTKTTKGKLDPLEENKVGAPEEDRAPKSTGKKRKRKRERDDATTKPEPAEAEPEPLPPPPPKPKAPKPVPMVAEKPAPSAVLPESKSGQYEVAETKTVSIRGHITAMPAGTVLNIGHYGRQVLENCVKQGLKLKAVE